MGGRVVGGGFRAGFDVGVRAEEVGAEEPGNFVATSGATLLDCVAVVVVARGVCAGL